MPVKGPVFKKGPLLFLGLILCLQCFLSMGRINEPLLDGRVHWYFDNALFLLRARHSNFHPPLGSVANESPFLKMFGTASYGYDDQGRVSRLNLYSHHPVLSPALFRLYAGVFGYANWVPRSFALLLSLLTTVFLFLLLRTFIRDDILSGLLTLLYTLLPLNVMFMDQWKYEIATNLLFVSCFYLLARIPDWRICRPLFLGSVFLLFQAEWITYFAVPCLLLYLYSRRHESPFRDLFSQTLVISCLAVLMNFAILYQLGFDLQEMRSAGESRVMEGIATVGVKNWFLRQVSFLNKNFGETNLALFLMGVTYLCLRRKRSANILIFGSLTLIFSTLCYVGIFMNLSLIHHFLQWSLGPAYVLLLGGILVDLPAGLLERREVRVLTLAVLVPVLIVTALGGYRLDRSIRSSTFGSPSDLEAIRVFRQRLVVFSDGRSGPVDWWFTPVIDLARDPVFQDGRVRGPVRTLDRVASIDAERDLVVVLNTESALNSFRKTLREKFGAGKVRVLGRSRSFSFFQVEKSPPDM